MCIFKCEYIQASIFIRVINNTFLHFPKLIKFLHNICGGDTAFQKQYSINMKALTVGFEELSHGIFYFCGGGFLVIFMILQMMYLYVAFSNHLILNVFIHYNDKDAILQSSQRKIVIRKGIIHLLRTQNFLIN